MAVKKTPQKPEVFDLDKEKKDSEKTPIKSPQIFRGSRSLSLTPRPFGSISEKYAKLIKLRASGARLAAEKDIKAYKFICDFFHYGKKAAGIYKSFVCNEILIDGVSEIELEEWRDWFASIAPQNTGNSGEKDLLFFIVRKIFIQGGLGFWLGVDENNDIRLSDISFSAIVPKYDIVRGEWAFDADWINLNEIKNALPPEDRQNVKYASDLEQFLLYFFDIDSETVTPIPFFSGAYADSYTEVLWRAFLQKIPEKMSLLKTIHYQVGKEADVPPGARFELEEELEQAVPGNPEDNQGMIKAVSKQITEGDKGIVAYKGIREHERLRDAYAEALVQANVVTDDNITINTYSTIESPGHFSIIGQEIRQPLSAALRVPGQLLELSQSRTETQIGSEVDIFLETVEELKDFVSSILTDIARFRSLIQQKPLPANFKISIGESKLSEGYKKARAARIKEEIRGLKLDNLLKLQSLGFDISEKSIEDEDLGYEDLKRSEPKEPTQPTPPPTQVTQGGPT